MRIGSTLARLLILPAAILISGCLSSVKPIPPINIAVADLGRENVSASDASMMSELLRGELAKITSFRVVEKNNMEKILEEHAFQKTGCTDQECAVKLGRILNVERMAIGTFGDFMGKKIVLLRLVDVETGSVICSESARGSTLEKLEKEVRIMASRLALCSSSNPSLPAAPKPVTLKIGTLPPAPNGEEMVEEEGETPQKYRDDMYFSDLIVRNMVEGPKTWTISPFRGGRALGWNRSITFTNRNNSASISVNRIGLRIIGLDGSRIYEGEQAIGLREVEGTPGSYVGLPVKLNPGQTRNIFLGASLMVDEALERKITDQEARVFMTYEFTQGGNTQVKKGEIVIRLNGSWAKSKMAPISGK